MFLHTIIFHLVLYSVLLHFFSFYSSKIARALRHMLAAFDDGKPHAAHNTHLAHILPGTFEAYERHCFAITRQHDNGANVAVAGWRTCSENEKAKNKHRGEHCMLFIYLPLNIFIRSAHAPAHVYWINNAAHDRMTDFPLQYRVDGVRVQVCVQFELFYPFFHSRRFRMESVPCTAQAQTLSAKWVAHKNRRTHANSSGLLSRSDTYIVACICWPTPSFVVVVVVHSIASTPEAHRQIGSKKLY